MKFLNFLYILSSLTLVSSATEDTDLPQFSLNSGFYDEDSIELEIKTQDSNAIIYYTLDGTLPNENSTIYKEPFILKNKSLEENILCNYNVSKTVFIPSVKLNKANVIRAMAKLSNGELTDVVSKTYFVGLDKKQLYQDNPVFNIITDPSNLFDYEKGIYVLGKDYDDWVEKNPSNADIPYYFSTGNFVRKGKENEIPATIEYFPSDGNTVTFSQDVGVRMKGRASRSYYQKSFRIIARDEYGKKNIKFDIIPGNQRSDGTGPVTKYKSFYLRNAGNDSRHSKIRDVVLQKLIKNDRLGFETQQSDYAVVFVDGEYWGIYGVYEEYSDKYISNNYDIDDKNVIIVKADFPYKIEDGEEADLESLDKLIEFILNNDLSIPSNFETVSEQLDIVSYAWYLAFCIYVDIIDGYFSGSNWSMWRVREPEPSIPKADGKWRMMLFDTEYSTGLYNEAVDYTRDVLKTILESDVATTSSRKINYVVAKKIIENEEFKSILINALCDMKNIYFENEKVQKLIEENENRLLPLITEHTLRNGPDEDLDDPIESYKKKVQDFKDYMNNRYPIFLELVQKDFGLKSPLKVTVTANNFNRGSILINDMNEFNESYTGEYFRENILYITAKPNEGNKLASWVLKNCKAATSLKSNTIGIYPKNNKCTVKANFN